MKTASRAMSTGKALQKGMTDFRDDWESLERVYRVFPATRAQRQAWRRASNAVYQSLSAQGHMGLPALIPGLVHARLATGLLAGGYRTKSQLADRSFLCLGCHAGLEVRILRDFGARRAMGVEIRENVVREAVRAHLVEPTEIMAADFWTLLTVETETIWDDILILAPQGLSLHKLWTVARPHLVHGGHLVTVAQKSDLLDSPVEVSQGVALEGTMQWYVLTND